MKRLNQAKLLKELETKECLTKDEKEELHILKAAKNMTECGFVNYLGRSKYYDRQGNEMSLWEWSNYLIDYEYKVIGSDIIGDYRISTVWLGLDHSWACLAGNETNNTILIFETMIFKNGDYRDYKEDEADKSEFDGYQERYSTEEEAIAGHLEACKLVTEKLKEAELIELK